MTSHRRDKNFPEITLRLRASAVHFLRSWVTVEQSGVALRFPPHSKIVRMNWVAVGQPQ
jgi:hypothetical protein